MLSNKTHQAGLNLPGSYDNQNTKVEVVKPHIGRFAWYHWFITKPLDWIVFPIYLGCVITLFFYPQQAGVVGPYFQWWQGLIVIVATLGLFSLDRYEFWVVGENISPHLAIRFLIYRIISVEIISSVNPNEVTFFLYLILPFSALLYFGYKIGVTVSIIVCLVLLSRVIIFPNPNFVIFRPWLFLSVYFFSNVFAITTALTLLHEKASRTKAEQLLIELKQFQNQLEDLAATKERNRLARDIHDSLGHYLTVINIQLDKAKAFREKNPAISEQALDDTKRLATEALQDVRESVKSLRSRQELFSLEKSLPLLVDNLRSERLTIEFEMNGSETGFSKQSLMVLYRVAQEGLTNVQRHSGSNWVRVCLNLTPRLAQLVIEDRGKGFEVEQSFSTGYGLRGIQERLEMVGGEFSLDSQPGKGTNLTVIITNEPESEEDHEQSK